MTAEEIASWDLSNCELAVLSAAALVPTSLLACNSKPSCNDASGLSTDEVNARIVTAAYVDQSADPAKKCSGCAQFLPAAPNKCGGCKVVKGPINPEGGCKLWQAKPA